MRSYLLETYALGNFFFEIFNTAWIKNLDRDGIIKHYFLCLYLPVIYHASLFREACFILSNWRTFMDKTLAIIGMGKLGRSLSQACLDSKLPLIGVFDKASPTNLNSQIKIFKDLRTLISAAEVIFLTVPDQEIEPLAISIANLNLPTTAKQFFFHCSGANDQNILKSLYPANTGCFHPLQAFTQTPVSFFNTFIAIDGNPLSIELATEIASKFSACAIHVPGKDKALYHAGACILANYLVSLTCVAEDIFSNWHIPRQALFNLLLGNVNNILAAKDTPSALTGPISRGDILTVEKHLQALPTKYSSLYRELGLQTLEIAHNHDKITTLQYQELFKILNTKELYNAKTTYNH